VLGERFAEPIIDDVFAGRFALDGVSL